MSSWIEGIKLAAWLKSPDNETPAHCMLLLDPSDGSAAFVSAVNVKKDKKTKNAILLTFIIIAILVLFVSASTIFL
jgi:hypothetical protein